MYPSKKLSEICEKITDGTHQTPTYFDSGYIFLSSKNVTSGKIDWDNIKYIDEKQHLEMYKRVTPKKGDILLAKNGTTGVAAIVDRDEIFDIYVSLALLCPKKEVYSEYLLYFINSSQAKKQFNSRLKGVGVPNLHLGEIKEVEIPLPPLSTQSRIVAKLDEAFGNIDKQIELLNGNIEDVENMKKSAMYAFADYPLIKIADIVDELFAGGDLPKDGKYSKEQTEEYKIPIYANAVKEEGLYGYTNIARVNTASLTISARGTIGYTKLRTVPFYPIVRLLVLIPKKELADLKFLEYVINTLNLKQFGSSIPQLSVPQLKNFEIPLPPLPRQHEIVARLDSVFDTSKILTGEYEAQIQDLESLKQSLLEEAFAGRLVV